MAETPLILGNNLGAKATITGQVNPDSRYKLARLVDGLRYTRWQSTDTVLKNLDFDVPSTYQRPVTCLVFDKGHTLSGVQVRFLYSDNASSYTQVDSFTPASNAVILRRFTGQVAHRYYRIELGSSAELHRIPQVWFGQAWAMEYNPVNPFDPDAKRLEYEDFETESGIIKRVDKFEKGVIDMKLEDIPSAMYANINTLFSDFRTYGGFLWYVFEPDTNPSKIMYMVHKMKDRRFPQNDTGAYREGSLQFEEVLG